MRDRIKKNLANRLRKARLAKALSLEDLAQELEALGLLSCTISKLNKIESGEQPCGVDIFAGLCIILDLDSDDFLFRKN